MTRSRLDYWTRRVAKADFVEVVVEDRSETLEVSEAGEVIEIVVGDVFVRFPDRPGMAQEILKALSKGAP